MEEARRRSNRQKGEANLTRLEQYLESTSSIPERCGKANISVIAEQSGVDRQVLYREEAQALILAAVERKGLGMPDQQRFPGGDQVPAWATQRIKALEESLAVAMVEVRDLRERLRRYEHLERHLTSTGLLPR